MLKIVLREVCLNITKGLFGGKNGLLFTMMKHLKLTQMPNDRDAVK